MTDMTDPHPEPDAQTTGAEPAAPAPRRRFSMDDLPGLRENHADGGGATPAHEQAEFTTVYDAIDAMERMLNEAKGSIFSPTAVKIDRDDFLEQLHKLERDVQAGLKVLEDRQQKAAAQLPRLDEDDSPNE